MTGPPIAYALVSGLVAYEAGAVLDPATYHKLKWASLPCCGFALLGGLQEIDSFSRRPLTGAALTERSLSEFLSSGTISGLKRYLRSSTWTAPHSPMTALSVLFCRLAPAFSPLNECRANQPETSRGSGETANPFS
jgi:hypothetical protein